MEGTMSRFIQQSDKPQNFKPIKAEKPTKPAPGTYTSQNLAETKKIISNTGGKY